MDATPDRSWRPALLAAIEAEFFALRQRPPNVSAAWRNAFRHAAGAAGGELVAAIRPAGDALVAVADSEAVGGELAYHNRHHVAEVVLAMGWLCGAARRMGAVTAEEAALAVVAMVGHDLLHDGSPPGGGVLEARSAERAGQALAAVALGERQRAVVRAVILGTDPGRVAENAARAARDLPPGPLGQGVDLVIAMANEADIFASLLPNLGWHLTHLLARERAWAGYPEAADIADPSARLSFLASYTRLSPAARHFGLGELQDRQIAAGASPALGRHFVAALPRVVAVGEATSCPP